jgi:NADP-dependent 3-hydroxy acid dehydrogenase YdfG
MSVAVITGAASGIGAGLAREAVRRGMKVVLADRDADALNAVATELGEAALAIPTDVADAASVEALAAAAYAAHGKVDMVFNNAGVLSTGLSW